MSSLTPDPKNNSSFTQIHQHSTARQSISCEDPTISFKVCRVEFVSKNRHISTIDFEQSIENFVLYLCVFSQSFCDGILRSWMPVYYRHGFCHPQQMWDRLRVCSWCLCAKNIVIVDSTRLTLHETLPVCVFSSLCNILNEFFKSDCNIFMVRPSIPLHYFLAKCWSVNRGIILQKFIPPRRHEPLKRVAHHNECCLIV